jgi:chromosome segregation ATPase
MLKIKTTDPTEVLNLKERTQRLEAELEAAKRERRQLDSEREKQEVALKQSRTELNKQKGEVEALEAELEGVRKERDKLKSEKEASMRKIKDLEEEIEKFDYAEVQGMIEMVESALDEDYDWEVNQEKDPIEALNERLTFFINEYESMEAELESYEKRPFRED